MITVIILTSSRAAQRRLNTVGLGISLDKWVLYLTFWAIQVILILTNNDLSSLEAVSLLSTMGQC